ncbi:MAG: hypothetical protein KDJ80_02965 [Nitratireductor sp.]|nr:hypothetical protein [Nitratireductor sp.]
MGAQMKHSIQNLKDQARRLRDAMAQTGEPIGHSQSLELVARQHGFRDWNTAHAACGNRPAGPPVHVGQIVEGSYLGQPFTAEIIGVNAQAEHDRYRVELDLAEPVDVVTFEGFSNFRRRVRATINRDGSTTEKTSNGRPQLELDIG